MMEALARFEKEPGFYPRGDGELPVVIFILWEAFVANLAVFCLYNLCHLSSSSSPHFYII